MITLMIINLVITLLGISNWTRNGNWFEEYPTVKSILYSISILSSFVLFIVLTAKYLP